ncbi:MAG TPA: hypothetical protein GYA07_12190 [Verrucomicrobia bacterium]|nr:hypothetical protein [Verrucomicrobiota bacterium]HOP97894.1 hypothetical protein [Verrucomicrobiota bacterium]HPU55787.1 hypothetical protein [Verrucomicrobiota bacterium]
MRRFGYCRDPLFIAGCILYAVNRWLVKPLVHGGLFDSYFNDFWLIPCALPPLLWLHRFLGLRTHDAMPGFSEVAAHLAFWSILFEWVGPRIMPRATGDPGDVIAYCAGAVVACLWWWRGRWCRRSSHGEL